jgi:Fe-S cluster biogenesis protein NfuA
MMTGEAPTPPERAPVDGGDVAERLDDAAARDLVERLESLLARLEALSDQLTRTMALDAVESLVRLYGEGLARILEQVEGARVPALTQALARDEVVSHLLLLHGIHPESLENRVRRALDEVTPSLRSLGNDVELVSIANDVARVRLTRAGDATAPPGKTARVAVESAVLRAAPELVEVEVEGISGPAQPLVTIQGPRSNGARRTPPEGATAASPTAHPPAP